MGRVKPARKNGTEMCPGCTEEARVNDKGESARHWDILEIQWVECPGGWTDCLSRIGTQLNLDRW